MTGSARVRLSVPGKLILIGEHAAVYGQPAVVAAVDARLVVAGELRPRAAEAPGLRLDLPDLDVREECAWPALEELGAAARARWQRFSARSGTFAPADDPAALVRIAVAEALASLAPRPADRLRSGVLELRLDSTIPVGGGLGSSAAVAVGVVAAVRRLARFRTSAAGAPGEFAAIERTALEVERRQHGFPSGIDAACVLRGGVLFARQVERGERRELAIERLSAPAWLRCRMEIRDSGAPASSTGAVVASVRERFEREPDRLDALFAKLGRAAEAFRAALERDAAAEAAMAIRAGHRALSGLGVVPRSVARRIRAVEAAGGVAKISGAGALDGVSAGAVVCMPGRDGARTADALGDWPTVAVRLGAPGLRIDVG